MQSLKLILVRNCCWKEAGCSICSHKASPLMWERWERFIATSRSTWWSVANLFCLMKRLQVWSVLPRPSRQWELRSGRREEAPRRRCVWVQYPIQGAHSKTWSFGYTTNKWYFWKVSHLVCKSGVLAPAKLYLRYPLCWRRDQAN